MLVLLVRAQTEMQEVSSDNWAMFGPIRSTSLSGMGLELLDSQKTDGYLS